MSQLLDWRRIALADQALIEASAGTGKTFNLSLLHLRLVLEVGLGVGQILVTTFTEAAAAELRSRIRARLATVERCLSDRAVTPPEELGEFLDELEARLGAPALLGRVRLALADIDLAPISTIHGFCRRVLADFPLETGAAFASGELVDEEDALGECVADYWRARFLTTEVDPWEASFVLAGGLDAFRQRVGVLLDYQPEQVELPAIEPVRAWWQGFCAREHSALRRKLEDDTCFKNAPNNVFRKLLRGLCDAAAAGDPGLVDWAALYDKLDAKSLAGVSPKACGDPVAGWPEVQELLARRADFLRLPERIAHACAFDCARSVQEELERRLVEGGRTTFSRMIGEVERRLGGEHGDALAARLRESWPVALIDEFQDTDARQWRIFRRLYAESGVDGGAAPGRRALLLIGDPKQAIYAFRGGDIHTYLQVRERLPAGRIHAIRHNYRSRPRLIEALNGLYTLAGEHAFGGPDIRYEAVQAGMPEPGPETTGAGAAEDCQGLCLRLLPAPPGKNLAERDELALAACVEDIRALLAAGRVQAGQIAVLLDSNARIRSLREMLQQRGVPVVGAGKGSVLDSAWAEDLQLLLHALLHPGDDAALRGALATGLLGHDATGLHRLAADTLAWQQRIDWFAERRQDWERGGILAVIEHVLHQEAPRLLAGPEGERALTDLRHLGELLQEAGADCYGPAQLYAWFVDQRSSGGEAGEARENWQLRIESDAHRVQLLTIHAAKGLEYPVVFLPMAWRRKNPPPGDPGYSRARYHDDRRTARIDLGGPDFEQHKAMESAEGLQERMRTLYVALTRAADRCVIYAFDDIEAHAQTAEGRRGALDLLLGAALAGLDNKDPQGQPEQAAASSTEDPEEQDQWQLLQQRLPQLAILRAALPGAGHDQTATVEPERRVARGPLPHSRPPWRLHSFTSLSRAAGTRPALATGGAEDEVEAALGATGLGELAPPQSTSGADPSEDRDARIEALSGLKGPAFGDAVHELLEQGRDGRGGLLTAADSYAQQLPRIALALREHAVRIEADGEPPLAALAELLDRSLEQELAPGLALGRLPPAERRAEFGFHFSLAGVDQDALLRLLRRHGLGHWWPGESGAAQEQLLGLMNGYIDLVFVWQGRYHLLDYKTNWLGSGRLADYQGEALERAMDAHHYGLQALLYSVALHRYLDQRMADYDPERHLGEAWYLFLRGFGLAPGTGVWRRRFPRALIEDLDALFAGRELPA